MAFPIGALISAVGQAGSSGGNSSQGGAGIGYNILGAPGDPAGVITNLAIGAKNRKEEKRRFDASNLLANKAFEEEKKQNAIKNSMDKHNSEVAQGLAGVQMLANQRATAMQNFNDRTFKNAYWRS